MVSCGYKIKISLKLQMPKKMHFWFRFYSSLLFHLVPGLGVREDGYRAKLLI